jgi:VWFA-related protein
MTRGLHPVARLAALAVTAAALAGAPTRPAAAQEQPQQPAPTPQYREHVEVQTVILEVRVVDSRNEPVRGLVAEDFRVSVGGKPIALDSVEWEGAPDRQAIADRLLAGEDVGTIEPPPPRLIVLFYQIGDDRSRLIGHVRMARQMDDFIDTLALDDKVAVVAFGSRLRVLLDFTDDRVALADAIKVTAINTDVERPRRTGSPSLVRSLDWGAAARATEPETALLLTANALEPIPGPKTMLMLGWGLGHLTRTGVVLDDDYGPARSALARAHTTVFTLDVTDADSHTLEVGLQQVAEDTGGTYSKTHEFPTLALDRIERALLGHYTLTFARPDLPDGVHPVTVELTRRKADVLWQDTIVLRH